MNRRFRNQQRITGKKRDSFYEILSGMPEAGSKARFLIEKVNRGWALGLRF